MLTGAHHGRTASSGAVGDSIPSRATRHSGLPESTAWVFLRGPQREGWPGRRQSHWV